MVLLSPLVLLLIGITGNPAHLDADLCLLLQPAITITWPDGSLGVSCFDQTSFNYMCFILNESASLSPPFVVWLL